MDLTDNLSKQRASRFDETDDLAVLLLQVCGPSHIAFHDTRWQELLLGYEIWVHLEHTRQPNRTISIACESMAKNAALSSNLAALSLHCSRMVRELQMQIGSAKSFTEKISLVAKARATAGSLNLLKTLTHDISPDQQIDAFMYRSRDEGRRQPDRMVGGELITSLLNYLTSMISQKEISVTYDATVISLQLLLILLSTQLYQPVITSMERKAASSTMSHNFTLYYIMEEGRKRCNARQRYFPGDSLPSSGTWSPHSFLQICLEWQLHRPIAPLDSVSYHMTKLVESIVSSKRGKIGCDGMYETYIAVHAERPAVMKKQNQGDTSDSTALSERVSSSLIINASKGVWVLSSSLILLPLRLVKMALGLLRFRGEHRENEPFKDCVPKKRRTNSVFWLTTSPIADLSASLLLILLHNSRLGNNPFRDELEALNDDRWEPRSNGSTLSDGTNEKGSEDISILSSQSRMTTNFENLFESFGRVVHNELGALLFYTLHQCSPSFAALIAVRSDLDTVVLPLLRTLYFSTKFHDYYAVENHGSSISGRPRPFRSMSHLYLNVILLLLFSQDTSFGPDAFRRIKVMVVPWYRERVLKDITLGSLLLLTLLRAITFNLNWLQDAFLLSNCCAVLMNLSPHVVELHEYAAMRLVTVTISSLKNYALHIARNSGRENNQGHSTPIEMYGEVVRTLLVLLKHSLGPRNIDKNMNLLYALLYQEAEFTLLIEKPSLLGVKQDLMLVEKIIRCAVDIMKANGDISTASKALQILESNVSILQAETIQGQETVFAFSYEEEADPEVFFIPYAWDIVVSVVTASMIDWDANRIKAFPLQ
jgi:Dyggve-Melchior-Clausen syndrome protein